MSEIINAKLARLLTENPDLPIKVQVSGELQYDGCDWCAGDLLGCEATEYVEHDRNERVYFGRGNDALWDCVRHEIWEERRKEMRATLPKLEVYMGDAVYKREEELECLMDEALPEAELGRLTRERIDSLDWKPCILLRVGPPKEG